MSLDIEDLGSVVFEEMAFDHFSYNAFLSESKVIDHYVNDKGEGLLTMEVNEVGKQPKRVKFKIILTVPELFKIDEERKLFEVWFKANFKYQQEYLSYVTYNNFTNRYVADNDWNPDYCNAKNILNIALSAWIASSQREK